MMGQSFGISATVVARLRLLSTTQTRTVELNEHISGISAESEQPPGRTIREFRIVRSVRSLEVTRDLGHDSLAARACIWLRSNGCPLRSLMTLSNFAQYAELSHATPGSPPASWVRSAAPRNRSQERPHEICARASRFTRVTSGPFRGLPWAQGVAGSNPVAPTRYRIGVTLSLSKGRPDEFRAGRS